MQANNLKAKSTSSRPSRAADLPQELFEDIAWHTIDASGLWGLQGMSVPSDHQSMRNIYSLSLVSTYFAATCRPRIFRNLRFCNAKQIRDLLILMEASPIPSLPHISTFVCEIHVKPVGFDDYWIHQVATTLLPKLKRHCDQSPEFTVLSLDGHGSLATPRTMMPLTARSIRELQLKDMPFRRGEELLRILAMFPVVGSCTLTGVSIGISALPDPLVIQRNLPSTSLSIIYFCECAPAIRTWLIHWLTSGPRQRVMSPWNAADLKAILELSRDFEVHGAKRQLIPYPCMTLFVRGMNISLHSDTPGRFVGDNAPQVRHIRRAELQIHSPDEESLASTVKASMKLHYALQHLQEIQFDFDNLSDLTNFVRTFHETLKHTVGSRRLLYHLGYPHNRYIDPHSILFTKGSARFRGVESGWCRTTTRGGVVPRLHHSYGHISPTSGRIDELRRRLTHCTNLMSG